VFNVNYKVADDVPYGCLKGGKKKTYREWKELSTPDIQDIADIVRPPTPPKKNMGVFLEGATLVPDQTLSQTTKPLSRDERLEQIKNKLRQIQDKETVAKQEALDNFKTLEKALSVPSLIPLDELNDIDFTESKNIEQMIQEREEKEDKEKIKKYTKKTIKRKFTLGKSDKLRRVSVLIKDRQTRKNIINTQKELKKTNITDVRKYLRQHGMIKVGSTCPIDILRKTFESAILTGEVTNTNKDTLLHNFMASVDEEKHDN
jgi:rubrerythrin